MESAPLMLHRRALDAERPSGLPKPKPVVVIDNEGCATYTTLRKQALVTDLRLRHRDIRALDPGVALPYPSAIFVRKGALVINLEGLKLIIGREKTLIISVPQLDNLSSRTPPDLNHPVVVRLSNQIAMKVWPNSETCIDSLPSFLSLEELRGMQSLPYELRALEAALAVMVKILEREVRALEDALAPVLRRLTRQVRRDDLETLYERQNRLDRVEARITRIKEILEELLDDDEEMAGMCLTRAELARQDSTARAAAAGEGADHRGGSPAFMAASPRGGGSCQGDSSGGGGCEETALDMSDAEVGECEDLTEAYWLQVDSLLSKVGILQERISNTQRLVNLDLDSKRNSLVALGLLVDLVLMCFEAHMVFTGIFGMNLTSGLEPYQPGALWAIAGLGLGTGLILMISIGGYAKYKGLLYMPSFGGSR